MSPTRRPDTSLIRSAVVARMVTTSPHDWSLPASTARASVGSDQGVRVAVADHLHVQVIRRSAAGEHVLMLVLGLRRGELLGRGWEDVDLLAAEECRQLPQRVDVHFR